MARSPDFWFTEGDLPDAFVLVISTPAGIANLTGATGIVFSMTNRNSGEVVIDHIAAALANAPGTDGGLRYTWQVADRSIQHGDYDAEFEWDQGGKHYSAPTSPKAWVKVVRAVATP